MDQFETGFSRFGFRVFLSSCLRQYYISPENFADIGGVAERSRSGNAVRKLLLLIRHQFDIRFTIP